MIFVLYLLAAWGLVQLLQAAYWFCVFWFYVGKEGFDERGVWRQ